MTIPANNGCKFSVASTSIKGISFASNLAANTHIYKDTTDPTLIAANKVTLGQANAVASGGSLYFAMFNDHATSAITVTVTGATISYVETPDTPDTPDTPSTPDTPDKNALSIKTSFAALSLIMAAFFYWFYLTYVKTDNTFKYISSGC